MYKYFKVESNYFEELKKNSETGKYVELGKNLFAGITKDVKISVEEDKELINRLKIVENLYNEALEKIFAFAKKHGLKFSFSHVYKPLFYYDYFAEYGTAAGRYYEVKNHVSIHHMYKNLNGKLIDGLQNKDWSKNVATHEVLHMLFTNSTGRQDEDGTALIEWSVTGANERKNMLVFDTEPGHKEAYVKRTWAKLNIDEIFTEYFANLIAGTDFFYRNSKLFCAEFDIKTIWTVLAEHKPELVMDTYLEFYDRFQAEKKKKAEAEKEIKTEIEIEIEKS